MLVSYPSLIALVPLLLTDVLDSHLGQIAPKEALLFVLVQGLGVGVASTLAYTLVTRLLGEQPTFLALCGVFLVAAGVLLSSRPVRG
ncbi:hypothetical protein [Polaromonas sp. SM01]|uniref:hypothetical protein n=1 Tax=Polaromonas sp. SM01 TaxID=3085630 RepID=UPI0029823A7C|nr:hypothetical protein [Polaromonas sp. SM01]MDW5441587.1 hypothetical protein [Polaromonas sp. SM01]